MLQSDAGLLYGTCSTCILSIYIVSHYIGTSVHVAQLHVLVHVHVAYYMYCSSTCNMYAVPHCCTVHVLYRYAGTRTSRADALTSRVEDAVLLLLLLLLLGGTGSSSSARVTSGNEPDLTSIARSRTG